MKRNDWLYILCIALYSFLFYEQTAGLNFLLFSIAIVIGLGALRPESIRTKHGLVSVALVLVSGVAVYLHGSKLAIAANVCALLIFAAQSAGPGMSLIISFFLSTCSVGGAYVFMIIDFFDRRAARLGEVPGSDEKPKQGHSGRVWAVIVAVLIVLLFFVMYRSTNVLFKELTKHINLDWISWKWCIFTAIGAVAVYGLFYVRKFGGIGENSHQYKRNLESDPESNSNWGDTLMSEDNERFLGILLFSLLNVLVVFVNGVDFLFQLGDHKMPEGITYTSYVHQGVGLLIVNVLLAMLLVLFFFRGRLNYNKSYNVIRFLAVLWLAQNVLMLFFMMGRNTLYTEMFGMTYKRIGVYFYLLLTAIGVATTAIKVWNKKTNTWLFRINTWLFMTVFVCSSLVSWSRFITWYSLYRSDYVNRAYLSKMSYQSIPYLAELNAHPEKFSQKDLNEEYEDEIDLQYKLDMFMNTGWSSENEFSVRVYRKVYMHLSGIQSEDWRSSTYNGARVRSELLAMPAFGTDTGLFLEYGQIRNINYYPGFSHITRLDLGNNLITSLGELGNYPNLHEVDLSNNQITSLNGIEKLQSLRTLVIGGNPIKDLTPLLKLPGLQVVYVNDINSPEAIELKNLHPNKNLIIK